MKLEIKMVFEDDTEEEAERSARLFCMMIAGDFRFFKRLRENGKAGIELGGFRQLEGDDPAKKPTHSAKAEAQLRKEKSDAG